jgi:hypothetical protein
VLSLSVESIHCVVIVSGGVFIVLSLSVGEHSLCFQCQWESIHCVVIVSGRVFIVLSLPVGSIHCVVTVSGEHSLCSHCQWGAFIVL